jgi:low affinity Fe/Cu permease
VTWYERVTLRSAAVSASAPFFLANVVAVLVWLAIGPLVGWSMAWLAVLTNAFTIVTQFVAILLAHRDQHDNAATQRKLDALIAATPGASNRLIALETADDAELHARAEADQQRRDAAEP